MEISPELDAEYRDAEGAMQSLLASAALGEVTCTTVVERGDVAEVLQNLAEEKHVGLVVLGTHGRCGLKKLVLGSTAEHIIRTVSCPVLTVGPNACRDAKPRPALGPILVAVDLDAWPQLALRFAASLANANHVPLILVHAAPPSLNMPEANLDTIPFTPTFSAELTAKTLATSRRHMGEMISAEQWHGSKPQIVVETGPAADLIVRTAEERGAGLIVMGAHQTGMPSVATHFPGATASAVLCEAPCPVLTIRN
jgi:nucleotide-binding universal stress UspA family protein